MQGELTALVAMTPSGVIGHQGTLPWHLRSDLQRFKRLTMGGVLIMGRRTYDSIGRPLPGRKTIVVTRDPDWRAAGVTVAQSPEQAVELAWRLGQSSLEQPAESQLEPTGSILKTSEDCDDRSTGARPKRGDRGKSTGDEPASGVYVVGGAEIYRQLLPQCRHLLLTRVWSQIEGDTKLQIDLSGLRLIEQIRIPAGRHDDVPSEFWRMTRSP